jgi:excisionase family DNA binding protein
VNAKRVSKRKAIDVSRPETLNAFADVLAGLLAAVVEKVDAGDYLLTVPQVAERWATSRSRVRSLIYSHALPCVQLGGGAVRIRAAVADAYVRGLEGAWQRPFPKVAA